MDRNDVRCTATTLPSVALRKESVDRNDVGITPINSVSRSLSARRAWIEIIDDLEPSTTRRVALRKESVDRNDAMQIEIVKMNGRSPQGERG